MLLWRKSKSNTHLKTHVVANHTLLRKDKPVGEVFSTAFSRDGLLDAAADVYTGYIFWTILTSLGALVWYFPLWHMGISGYEVMVMSTVSPFLLGIGPLRRLIIANIRYVHLLSLSGVLAYLVVRPDYRLFAVGFGVWTSCLAWTATFYAERSQPAKLEGRIAAFGLGLVLSTISKFAFQTNNPVWPIVHGENGGWNKTGILLAILAMWRTSRTRLGNPDAVSGSKTPSGSSVLAGFGLAGLFFGMHSLLSDSSTMILWVWEGYPVRGPLAVPHGAVTIAAMSFGLLIGLYYPGMAGSWTFYGIGATGAAVLTGFSHWTGYYGGLALATYLMAVSPVLIKSAVLHPPGRTFFLGFFLYNFLVLAHVWVVAYAFVPGGPVMREHTDWVMTATMLFIGAGVFSATASNGSRAKSPPPNPAARKLRSYFVYVLLGLQLLSASVAYLRFPLYDYTPYHGPEKSITAGIWTIHFSLDNEMWTSERRMESLIREMELDVVGLLESDLQRIIMGNRDTTQYLAEELGMWVDYGPGPNKHTWGCALLSKFPIVNSTHHLLPSPVGELAPAIHATVDAYGTLVDVFVFHSGQEEDPEDRRLQSLYLSDLMKNSPRPSILLSYLVTKPKEGNYNTYVGEMSGMKDIDSSDWDRWCEYILYKGLRRTGYARVSRGTITDTELQVSEYAIPPPVLAHDQPLILNRSANSSSDSLRVAMRSSRKIKCLKGFDSRHYSKVMVSEDTGTTSLMSQGTTRECNIGATVPICPCTISLEEMICLFNISDHLTISTCCTVNSHVHFINVDKEDIVQFLRRVGETLIFHFFVHRGSLSVNNAHAATQHVASEQLPEKAQCSPAVRSTPFTCPCILLSPRPSSSPSHTQRKIIHHRKSPSQTHPQCTRQQTPRITLAPLPLASLTSDGTASSPTSSTPAASSLTAARRKTENTSSTGSAPIPVPERAILTPGRPPRG